MSPARRSRSDSNADTSSDADVSRSDTDKTPVPLGPVALTTPDVAVKARQHGVVERVRPAVSDTNQVLDGRLALRVLTVPYLAEIHHRTAVEALVTVALAQRFPGDILVVLASKHLRTARLGVLGRNGEPLIAIATVTLPVPCPASLRICGESSVPNALTLSLGVSIPGVHLRATTRLALRPAAVSGP